MNTYIKTTVKLLLIIAFPIFWTSCANNDTTQEEHNHKHAEHAQGKHIVLNKNQFEAMNFIIDTLGRRNLSSYVEANGELQVPPQNEATVTAIIGANILSINVIEGENVKKGQALAYLIHPDLIKLQTDYINNWNQLQYLEAEYHRQKRLYEENVGSGKEFQRVKANYFSTRGMVQGYEAQLKLMGMNIERLHNNELYEKVPVVSPIDGYVRFVFVKTGQYVSPSTSMFQIIDNDHVHADLMVFEKDVHKVKEGQKVMFTVQAMPNKEFEATIFSVGKAFEQDPKAVHLHADIKNPDPSLIPGMYIRGRILVNDSLSFALPEDGVVHEGNTDYIFTAKKVDDHGETSWLFEPVVVVAGTRDEGWVEVRLIDTLPPGTKVAWNNAYYLLAEMKKEEAGHSH